jgi:hypothetical protein
MTQLSQKATSPLALLLALYYLLTLLPVKL